MPVLRAFREAAPSSPHQFTLRERLPRPCFSALGSVFFRPLAAPQRNAHAPRKASAADLRAGYLRFLARSASDSETAPPRRSRATAMHNLRSPDASARLCAPAPLSPIPVCNSISGASAAAESTTSRSTARRADQLPRRSPAPAPPIPAAPRACAPPRPRAAPHMPDRRRAPRRSTPPRRRSCCRVRDRL